MLAGPRAPPYNEWRDQVLLEALRLYRARTEGAALETVPPVTYSMKPKADGRKDGSNGQRGILGFEWRTAPLPYKPLPIDEEVCAAEEPRDDEALEREYIEVLESLLTKARGRKKQTGVTAPRKEPVGVTAPRKRKIYMCPTCNVPKKGHVCPAKKRKGAVVKRAGKRARK